MPGVSGGIPETMRAVVYRGVGKLTLETLPVPRIGPGELLVRVACCGVCPTDIKKILHGTVAPPRVFGHETSGWIAKVGARVRGFGAGDRVALYHHVPCMDCHFCRHGAFAQCATYKRTGITAGFEPAGGGYAEYVRVMPFVLPGVVRIPARNTFLEAAMLEPVNTVLKAVKRLKLLRGDSVLVAGQGPIGLLFTRLLALEGMRVVATDLLETRLGLAREFGAERLVQIRSPKSEVRRKPEARNLKAKGWHYVSGFAPPVVDPRLASVVSRLTNGRGLDAAVIAVPSDAVVREAQALVRGGGQVLLFSHTRRGDSTSLDLATVCVDEKDLVGSYSADIRLQEEVARLVFSRKLDTRRLITHEFPLAQTAAAVELASQPTAESLKIVVAQDPAQP